MKKTYYYQYYVEGDNEKTLINTLKTNGYIVSGKVEKINVIQETLTLSKIMTLKQNTIIILLYDTDVEKTDILEKNIALLKSQSYIKEVYCIPQIKNLEEELCHCCSIKKPKELTGSKSAKDFKRDFILCRNLPQRLSICGFSLDKLWSRQPPIAFKAFGNDSSKIKLLK